MDPKQTLNVIKEDEKKKKVQVSILFHTWGLLSLLDNSH